MKTELIPPRIARRFYLSAAALLLILIFGTIGYYYISDKNYSLIDCLYMTVITITTVGFSEIIDMSHNPSGRVFTMFIAFSGLGISTFIISNIAAIIVSGEIQESYKQRKMSKQIGTLENHYIICGVGRVGSHILKELNTMGKMLVVVEKDDSKLSELSELFPELSYIKGDADEENVLLKAGIKSAKGIFASTGDDNENLVITLTAKYLNPNIKVVTRCLEAVNEGKIKRAGADSIIKENYTAAIRMASEMVRPGVLSFIENMEFDRIKNFSFDEILINEKYSGKPLSELHLENYTDTLLFAVLNDNQWTYVPKPDHIIKKSSKLIIVTSVEDRKKLKEIE